MYLRRRNLAETLGETLAQTSFSPHPQRAVERAVSQTLWGVGVGPGAPDLVTLRAIDVLRRADVLVLPRSNDYGESVAWSIVKEHVRPSSDQERLPLTFPMSDDAVRVRAHWDLALEAIGKRIEAGRSVAFVTEGDPSLYSTFVYLAREAPKRWPHVRVQIIPGVTSVTAVPAVTGIPLADGQERVAIVPAAYGLEDVDELLVKFDTLVFMKIGGEMPRLVAALERARLLDKAVYVAKATMGAERIVRDLRQVTAERGDCFAMVVVARRERSGVVLGEVPRVPMNDSEARHERT
jgi:precorrin-2/cobalt-factor-2 C20-methyltransferase